jgi:pimeloyl-ACP methyl ester carboxylesterase
MTGAPSSDPTPAGVRRWRAADGLSLAGEVTGAVGCPTVVLLHGGGQTRHSWAGAASALVSAGYRVISYDARGHGESDWSDAGNYGLDAHAQDLMTVLGDTVGAVGVVGASLGGAAIMQALGSGYRPTAVAFVDIVPRPDPEGVARIRAFMLGNPDGFESLEEVADAIAAYNPHRPRPRSTAGLERNLRKRPDGRFRWHWDPAILGPDPALDIAAFEQVVAGLSAARDVPMLLVRGMESDVVGAQGIAELREMVPGIEVADVAGAGHMVAGDRNDAFNATVLAFLDRHLHATDEPNRQPLPGAGA